MSTGATLYPTVKTSDVDNTLFRRILYALANGGAAGMAPQEPTNTLLRQILWQLQNNFPSGGGGSGPEKSFQLIDTVTAQVWTVTAQNGILTLS